MLDLNLPKEETGDWERGSRFFREIESDIWESIGNNDWGDTHRYGRGRGSP